MWKERYLPTLLATGLFSLANGRLTDYVDPLIGTAGPNLLSSIASGNVFPGPCLPNGMAKPGIDTSYLGLADGTQTDHNGGYSPIGNFTAVSMMHVTGTGGDPTCEYTYDMREAQSAVIGVHIADPQEQTALCPRRLYWEI
jgi:putative alpha-1,2-mannosidase